MVSILLTAWDFVIKIICFISNVYFQTSVVCTQIDIMFKKIIDIYMCSRFAGVI